MKVVGIDYSMTSPACCTHPIGVPWDFKNCEFFFLTKNKKFPGEFLDGQIKCELFKDYPNDSVRFLQNAAALKRFIEPDEYTFIALEGYAFGAKGSRIFQIAEATGILMTLLMHDDKGNLINRGNNLVRVAPPTVKKYATGKGNANKDMMIDSFQEETGHKMVDIFQTKKIKKPADDISDSYWLTKYLYENKRRMLS